MVSSNVFYCAVEYQLSNSALNYFQRMEKILDPSYTPNEQIKLQSHINSTGHGIVETLTSDDIT